MLTLIKKEIMLCRTGIFLLAVIGFLAGPISMIFISLMTLDTIGGLLGLILSLFFGFFITMGTSLDKEKKVEGHMIYYSLPIDRELIVRSKYISAAIFPIGQSIVIFIFSYIYKWTKGFEFMGNIEWGIEIRAISIFNMIIALTIIFLFLSIFLFIYFNNLDKEKKENKLLKTISSLSWIIVIIPIYIIPEKYWSFVSKSLQSWSVRNLIIIIGFIFSLFIYFVSMEISKKRVRR